MMRPEELEARIESVRASFKSRRIEIPVSAGIGNALASAEKIAAAGMNLDHFAKEHWGELIHDCHVVWAFADSLKTCEDAGLDVENHLRVLVTGSTDYGTPKTSDQPSYFKDFELELFIASALVRSGSQPRLNLDLNDPRGDIEVGQIRIEVKHPDSPASLKNYARTFNSRLKKEGRYGIVAVGLEDAFDMYDESVAGSLAELRDDLDSFGLRLLWHLARMPRILGTIQTATVIERVAPGGTSLIRRTNAFLLDIRNGVSPNEFAAAEEILKVFNPSVRRYSDFRELADKLHGDESAAETVEHEDIQLPK